ncbi:MAG: murein biosynthesis integral membrane protein MurJ [Acidobacteria bacterium]|nr:MAG: murein biosynthesis integral membrane protein MurJ [Acidobacteriota bacterium]
MNFLNDMKSRIHSFNGSVNGRIFTAAITVATMTAAVKAAAMLKDIIVAHYFGAGDALDAFYLALLLPNFLMSAVGESFGASFIPVYIELRETQGCKMAQQLLASLTCCGLAAFLGVSILLAASSGAVLPLIGSGFDQTKLGLARMLLAPLLLWLGLCGINALWHAALIAHERFSVSAIAPILIPLAIIASLAGFASRWGVYAVAIGSLVGGVADLIFCGIALRHAGIPLFPRWHGFSPALLKVFGQFAPLVTGGLLMGSSAAVDQTMAAMLSPGSVAALNYANKLVTLPIWIGVHSLSVAVFPSFSRLSAKEDWAGMRDVLRTYVRLSLLVSLPLTFILVRYSEPLVALIFQGGAFTANDVRMVAHVQMMLCLQLPFYAIGILYVRALSSLKHNQVLMWGTIINVLVNIVLNLVLMRMIGLPGIALSTSFVYAISCGFLWLMLDHVLRGYEIQSAYRVDGRIPALEASDG